MQKRQANPKLPSKSLILIGSRQERDGKSISSSASVRGCSSFCSVTTPSGCRLARGTRPERGRRVVGYVTALSLPAQPAHTDATRHHGADALRCAGLRFFANLARNAGFSEPRTKILDGI